MAKLNKKPEQGWHDALSSSIANYRVPLSQHVLAQDTFNADYDQPNGRFDNPISYFRPADKVRAERDTIYYYESKGRSLIKSGSALEGIANLEYAAMIAEEGNHYERFEGLVGQLDDLYEEHLGKSNTRHYHHNANYHVVLKVTPKEP